MVMDRAHVCNRLALTIADELRSIGMKVVFRGTGPRDDAEVYGKGVSVFVFREREAPNVIGCVSVIVDGKSNFSYFGSVESCVAMIKRWTDGNNTDEEE